MDHQGEDGDAGALASSARKSGTQCIHRSLGVLRLLAGSPPEGVKLTDIANALDLSHPTAHRILKALEEEGVVDRVRGSRRYTIGSEAIWLGLPAAQRFPIASIAGPALDRLCETVGDSIFLAVRSRNDSVYVDRRIGSYPIQATRLSLGARRPLGVSVAGRAMMGFLSKAKVDAILDENEGAYSKFKLSRDKVAEDLGLARERGYLLSGSLVNRERRVLSAPVLDIVGSPVAAVSIIASVHRLPAERIDRVVPQLKAAVREIGDSLIQNGRKQIAC
ncbi:IclR family transcriptional regulator [Donghicola mangrovi]|uniref:IclR family transcriptional regulator n=1 Tax=Donghicola mangrovi TaxID=2729614 RepID=A0A850QGR7_9RHOB|nr:IclR family transcriptional regulator [Donghicola mangrovi]NVO25565.1 IclR family transcriptional regulator [Donghicola mangrovi]